jgi:hypothetical protein
LLTFKQEGQKELLEIKIQLHFEGTVFLVQVQYLIKISLHCSLATMAMVNFIIA